MPFRRDRRERSLRSRRNNVFVLERMPMSIPPPLPVPDAILKRRAVKSFRPEPIDPDLLRRIVELTVAAPSSYNLQDWRIVLVRSPEQKAALQKAENLGGKRRMGPERAPSGLVVGHFTDPEGNLVGVAGPG